MSSVQCTRGVDGKLYYFRDGKRISAKKTKGITDCAQSAKTKTKAKSKTKTKAKPVRKTTKKVGKVRAKIAAHGTPKPSPKRSSPKRVSPKRVSPKKATPLWLKAESPKLETPISKKISPQGQYYIWQLGDYGDVEFPRIFPILFRTQVQGKEILGKKPRDDLYAKLGVTKGHLVYTTKKVSGNLEELNETLERATSAQRAEFFNSMYYPALMAQVFAL